MAHPGFLTTRWSVVLEAREAGQAGAEAAWAALCGAYWAPLRAYLRRTGVPPADAEDLVQGFFERLLARDSLREVAPEKGRFRFFLLAALRHHVLNRVRDSRAQRRGGGAAHVPWDEREGGGGERAAELAYDREWARTVMENAARRLRQGYEAGGRGALFEQLRPWLAREAQPGEYARCASALGMTEGSMAVAVHRLRHRFRSLIREEVALTVPSAGEIDEEMRHLFRVLTEASL